MKALKKIDRFYFILTIALVLLAVLLIYAFRQVFSAITTAYEVDTTTTGRELRLDKNILGEAYESAFNKEIVPLDVR